MLKLAGEDSNALVTFFFIQCLLCLLEVFLDGFVVAITASINPLLGGSMSIEARRVVVA